MDRSQRNAAGILAGLAVGAAGLATFSARESGSSNNSQDTAITGPILGNHNKIDLASLESTLPKVELVANTPRFIVYQTEEGGAFKVATAARNLTAPAIEADLGIQGNWYGCSRASTPEEAVAEAQKGGYRFR